MSRSIVGVAAMLSVLTFASCATDEPRPTNPSLITVTITPPTPVVQVGQSVQLTATATGVSTQGFLWSSSDERIATVNQAGLIIGVAKGTAKITVSLSSDPAAMGAANVTVQ
jgi:uncharacterized protein YjdB